MREQNISEFNHTFEKLKTEVNEKNRMIVEDFIARKALIFYDISQFIQEIEQTEAEEEQKHPVDSEIIKEKNGEKKSIIDDQKVIKATKTNFNGESFKNQTSAHEDGNVENNLHGSFETNGSSSNMNDKILAMNEIFHDTCNKTYDDLMNNEDILHEQLMDLISTLDRVYLDSHVDSYIRFVTFSTGLR